MSSQITDKDLAELGLTKSAKEVTALGTFRSSFTENSGETKAPHTSYLGDTEDDSGPLKSSGYEETLQFPTPLHLGYVILSELKNSSIQPYVWQIEQLEEIARESDGATWKKPYRLALCAANGSGKDSIIVRLTVLWIALRYKRSLQIITSSSGAQLTSQTENFIKAGAEAVNTFFGCQIFRIRQRYIKCNLSGSEIRMFATDEAGKAEGYHPLEPGAKMAIWVNEAKSVAEEIFQALRRCTGYTHWFNISTPDAPKGSFYQSCRSPYFRFRRVTSYDCPAHLSEDDREQDKIELGVDSSLYRSKHLALFTSLDGEVVIPLHLLEKSRCSNIPHRCKHWQPRVGIDLAAGGDENSITIARGNRVSKEDRLDFREVDTTITAERIDSFLKERGIHKDNPNINADDGGIGHAIIDMLVSMGWSINRINNQSAAYAKGRYGNRGAENWYRVKRFFELGFLIPPDFDKILIEQLGERYFKQSGDRQRIYLESKKDAKLHGRRSPDRADSYVLAYCNISVDDFQEAFNYVDTSSQSRFHNTAMTREQLVAYYANMNFSFQAANSSQEQQSISDLIHN